MLQTVPRSCAEPQLDARMPVEKHAGDEVTPFLVPVGAPVCPDTAGGTDMWGAQMPSRWGAESDEAPRCRICFDGASEEDGDLIEPCACRGTQRYIHKSCLVQWQASFLSIRRPLPFCSSPAYPIVCD